MKKISYLLLIIVLVLGTMLLSSCQKHEHNYETLVVEPTCSNGGYTQYTCLDCGYSMRGNFVGIDYSAHDFYDVKEIPSTCIEKGFMKQRCSICFVENVVELDYAEHTYGEWSIKEVADCDGGVETRACTLCSATEDRATDPVHTYTAIVTDPTCTSKGYTTHVCVCGDSYKDSETDKVEHVLGDWVVIDVADCDGGIEERVCLNCNTYSEKRGLDIVHNIEVIVTAPTCERGGYTTYRCVDCGYEYFRDYVEPTGHSFVEVDVYVKDSTCYRQGYEDHYYACEYCGTAGTTDRVYLPLAEHVYVEYRVEQPTCTGKGYTYYRCENYWNCYETKYDNYVDSKGHAELVFVETIAPTCTSRGYTVMMCPDCYQYFETDEVASLGGHAYEYAVIDEATCTGNEYGEYTCTVCGDSYRTYLSGTRLGHDYDEGVVTEGTCTTHGYTTYTCTRENCGHNYVDDLTQPKHVGYTWEVILESYCMNLGLKKGICECGDVIYKAYTVDHDWDYSIEVVPPRYDADGYVIETCHCGEFRHVDIKKLSISDGLNFKLEYSDDGYVLSRLGSCTDVEVAIPQYVEYFEELNYGALPITQIRYYTFYNYTELTTITIPRSVRVIGISAFENCTNLTYIVYEGTMEEWNNVVKHNNWDLNTGDYTVYCSDGNITK